MPITNATGAQLVTAGFVNEPNSRVYHHPLLPGMWFFTFKAGDNVAVAPGIAAINPAGDVVFSTRRDVTQVRSFSCSYLASKPGPNPPFVSGSFSTNVLVCSEKSRDTFAPFYYGYNGAVVAERQVPLVFPADYTSQFGVITGSCAIEGYVLSIPTLAEHVAGHATEEGWSVRPPCRASYLATSEVKTPGYVEHLIVSSLKFAAAALPEDVRVDWFEAAMTFAQYAASDPMLSRGLVSMACRDGALSIPMSSGVQTETSFAAAPGGWMSSAIGVPEGAVFKPAVKRVVSHGASLIDLTRSKLLVGSDYKGCELGAIGALINSFADSLLGFKVAPTLTGGNVNLGVSPTQQPIEPAALADTRLALSAPVTTEPLRDIPAILAIITDAIGYADAKVAEYRFMPVYAWLFTFQNNMIDKILPDAYAWNGVPEEALLATRYGTGSQVIAVARVV